MAAEQKTFFVVEDSNPRTEFLVEDLTQSLLDFETWINDHAPDVAAKLKATAGATDAEIADAGIKNEHLAALLKAHNGNVPFYDDYLGLTCGEIKAALASNSSKKGWSPDMFPFAANSDGALLVIGPSGVIDWDDEGPGSARSKSLGAFLDGVCKKALSRKLQYYAGEGGGRGFFTEISA